MNLPAQSNVISMTFVKAVRAGKGDRWFYDLRSFTDSELAGLSDFFDRGKTRGVFHHFNFHHVPLGSGKGLIGACFDIYDDSGRVIADIMLCQEDGDRPEVRFSAFRGLDNVKVFTSGAPEDRPALFEDFRKKLDAEMSAQTFIRKGPSPLSRVLDAWARRLGL